MVDFRALIRGFRTAALCRRARLGVGPAFESLPRRKPRVGKGAVWLGAARPMGILGPRALGCGRGHDEQLSDAVDVAGANGAGEEAVVANAVEAARQDMQEKAADETRRRRASVVAAQCCCASYSAEAVLGLWDRLLELCVKAARGWLPAMSGAKQGRGSRRT